jgi:hypothetical protein
LKHRLFNFLTVLSLLLCVAVAALWARSYWQFDDVAYSGHFHVDNFASYRGRAVVQLGWSTTDDLSRAAPPYSLGGWFWDSTEISRMGYPAVQQSRGWQFGGFDARRWVSQKRLDASGRPEVGEDIVIVPYWFLCLLAAAAPLHWLRRHRFRRLGSAWLCPQCGYDLRSTPDRCPECGAPPAAPAKSC